VFFKRVSILLCILDYVENIKSKSNYCDKNDFQYVIVIC